MGFVEIAKIMTSRINIRIILSILGLFAFFIMLRWNSFNAPFIRDEGEYAYSAWLLRQDIVPYVNAFMQKPPMIIYSYALAQLINQDAYWPPRILAYVFVALATVLTALIARKEFGEGAGLAAAWLVTPMFLLPGLQQQPANVEMFLVLPFMLAIACYIFNRGKASGLCWFSAGLFSALSVLYKPTVLLILSFMFIKWGFEAWRYSMDPGRVFKNIAAGILGGALASSAVLGYFLSHRAFGALWECVVDFNRHYAACVNFQYGSLVHYLLIFLQNWWGLFAVTAYFIVKCFWRAPLYIWLFVLAAASTCASSLSHYYIILMPFWAILAAGAVNALTEKAAAKSSFRASSIRTVILTTLLITMVWGTADNLLMSPRECMAAQLSGENPFYESPAVARRVAELTSADDRVFIAGSEPQILYYAKRKSATRFVIMYPLVVNTPMAPGYQERAIEEISSDLPKVIVLATSRLSWGRQPLISDVFNTYLRDLLKNRYVLVGGFLKAGDPRWQEPLDPGRMKSCSLLVFKKT